MRKTIFLLFFVLLGSYMCASTWVIGTNQVSDLLNKIEQGTGGVPPAVPENTDKDKWENLDGITLTGNSVTTSYQDHSGDGKWHGFYSINFTNKGYKQKEGASISFIQPSLNSSDYSEVPEGYTSMVQYWDRNDLSWLEILNFSGNDFHTIKIDGNNIMPLKTVNISNNPNLKSFSIINCSALQSLDITGCNLFLPEISDIISNTGSAVVTYEYQGKMSFSYNDVDLTEFLAANGPGATVLSWSIQPESNQGNVYIFDSGMIGQTVSVTIVSDAYPGISLTYNIELLKAKAVDFVIDAAFTAIEIENITNPNEPIFIGDEVLISVNAFSCSVFKSFTVDGVNTTLDGNNQYRITTTKASYVLSAVSEETDIPDGLTTDYMINGSFESGLNENWEYFVGDNADATFSASANKIFDGGSTGLKIDVNSLDGPNSVYAKTRVTVGCDSLYLLQFWAQGPEEAKLYVEIDGSEQKGILYGMRVGNEGDKGKMVAYHYPFKIDKTKQNRELEITFYFQSDITRTKSNDPNNCNITEEPGATYYLDGLVLVDQNNDMHHDVFNTYLWNYNQVANQNGQSWTAGDNDVSFDLPDGRRMWFFNDSFYGNNLPGTNVFPGGTFTRNAVVIQNTDGSLHSLPITNQGGQWTYFRIPDEDVIYNTNGDSGSGVKNVFWVGDALIEDGEVKVYLIEVYGNDRSYLGKFTYPGLEFIGIEEQEPFCRRYEKFFVEDDMIYLYANGGEGWTRTMYAARAELGDMNGKKGTWEFWDGTAWNKDNTKAVEVSNRGADDVIKLGEGNYAQLSMPVLSPEVYVNFAPSPEGPWEHATLVGVADQSANFWYYMPNFHGQLANGKYSISMSANYWGCLFFCKDCENQVFTDKYWYRPRYIQVDLLALSPYTTTTTINITQHPAETTTVTEGSITGSLSVTANVEDGSSPSYQWYSCEDAAKANPEAIAGATGSGLVIPTTLTAGTYYYYVEVNASGAASITSNVATVIVDSPTYDVSIGTFAGGTVSTNKASYEESEEVVLTVTPDPEYVLNVISAYKTGDSNTAVQLNGSENTYTFAMPSYGVTVTATFRNPNMQEVYAAKELIENSTFSVAQATANGEAYIKNWLAEQVNALISSTGITVSTENITVNNFTPATTGGPNGSFTFTITLSNGSSSETATNSGTIVATPLINAQKPTINEHPQGATVSIGKNITLSVTASISDDGALTYQWYSNSTNSNSGGTLINQATASSYSPLTDALGTVYYYVIVTNTNNKVNGINTEATTSQVAAVTVNNLVNAQAPDISTQPQSSTVNVNETVTLSVSANVNDNGKLSYQWYSNTANSNSEGTKINGATASSYSPPTNTIGIIYYYVIVTNTNNDANGTKTAEKNSNVAAVTVKSSTYTISLAAIANGTITAEPTSSAAGETITLTISPSEGYELEGIKVYKTGAPDITVSLSGTGDTRTFTMPAYDVTVQATFTKTQSQLDQEAVEAAKAEIEGGTYHIAQATGNTESTIKPWLVNTLSILFGQSGNIQLRSGSVIDAEVAISSLTPAIGGTEENPAGTNGSFVFTVKMTKGETVITTEATPGVIIATPHSSVTVKRIELLLIGDQTIRIFNTGNTATSSLTLTLSGSDANAFTLSQTSVNSLAEGDEMEVTFAPQADLTAGTYTITFTANGEGIEPVSLEITYYWVGTGINDVSASGLRAISTDNGLLITGLIPGEVFSIFNIQGQLLYNSKAIASEQSVHLAKRGLYIIVADNRILKTKY